MSSHVVYQSNCQLVRWHVGRWSSVGYRPALVVGRLSGGAGAGRKEGFSLASRSCVIMSRPLFHNTAEFTWPAHTGGRTVA